MAAKVVQLRSKLNGSLTKEFKRADAQLTWGSEDENFDLAHVQFLANSSEFDPDLYDHFTAQLKFPRKYRHVHRLSLTQFEKAIRANRYDLGERNQLKDWLPQHSKIEEELDRLKPLEATPQLLIYRVLRANFGEPLEIRGWGDWIDEDKAPQLRLTENLAFCITPKKKDSLFGHAWKSDVAVIHIEPSDNGIDIECFSDSKRRASSLWAFVSFLLLKHLSENTHLVNERHELNSEYCRQVMIRAPYKDYKSLAISSSKRAANAASTKRKISINSSVFHSILALECLANVILTQIFHKSDQHAFADDIMINADIRVKYLYISSQADFFKENPLPVGGDLWKKPCLSG